MIGLVENRNQTINHVAAAGIDANNNAAFAASCLAKNCPPAPLISQVTNCCCTSSNLTVSDVTANTPSPVPVS